MLLPGRHSNTSDYRYGFNGKELDSELKGEGNSYDFGSRNIFDPRVARFNSIDPREREYPEFSPYSYALNNPILFIDEDGEGPGLGLIVKLTSKENAMKLANAYKLEGKVKSSFMAYMGYMNGHVSSIDPDSGAKLMSNTILSVVSNYAEGQRKISTGEASFSDYMIHSNHLTSAFHSVSKTQILDLYEISKEIYAGDAYGIGQGLAIGTQLLLTGKTVGWVKGRLRTLNVGKGGPTVSTSVKGWRLGDPINNLTREGKIPTWKSVKKRYWKNRAYYALEGEFSEANLGRMRDGKAPQNRNPVTGELESMELEHYPYPQREGGLYDVLEVTPDQHDIIDSKRHTGRKPVGNPEQIRNSAPSSERFLKKEGTSGGQ